MHRFFDRLHFWLQISIALFFSRKTDEEIMAWLHDTGERFLWSRAWHKYGKLIYDRYPDRLLPHFRPGGSYWVGEAKKTASNS